MTYVYSVCFFVFVLLSPIVYSFLLLCVCCTEQFTFGCDVIKCVKERGEDRYCCRAGVMSRNEEEEEDGLFVLMDFLLVKARLLKRVTVVREGMSACEDRVIRNTLQIDDTRKAECPTVTPFSSECSEFRQVYSSVHFIIITSHYQFT